MWPLTNDMQDAAAEVRITHQGVAALNLDVKKSNVPAEWKDNWYTFATDWLNFAESIKSLSVYSTAIYEKAIEYRKRLIAYNESFKRAGGKPTVDPPPPPPQPKAIGDYVVTGVMLLALIGGGAYIIGQKVKG